MRTAPGPSVSSPSAPGRCCSPRPVCSTAGGRATTHWAVCDHFARTYPRVEVDPDPVYVRDGHIATSAGVTAGIDLTLALVEEDHGRDIALTVARPGTGPAEYRRRFRAAAPHTQPPAAAPWPAATP